MKLRWPWKRKPSIRTCSNCARMLEVRHVKCRECMSKTTIGSNRFAKWKPVRDEKGPKKLVTLAGE